MPLFAYVGRDGPRGAEPRKLYRPEHLDHIAKLGERVHFAGPLRGIFDDIDVHETRRVAPRPEVA